MVRINLIPPEIIEKRKYERIFGFIVIAGILFEVVVLLVYGVLAISVNTKQQELQDIQTIAAQTRATAEDFAVFEQRESILAQRLQTAELALADRVDWGRFAEELSLVLPDDTWVQALACDQSTGIQMSCVALDDDLTSTDHKAVAITLVRLAQLEQLNDVWLTSSVKSLLTDGDWEQPVIEFAVTAGLE